MNVEIKICIKEDCNLKVTANISIHIDPASSPDLQVDTSGVPTNGQVGQAFSGQLKVTGGQAPYSFSLVSGNLPDGVSLLSDGSLSGTPTAAGDFSAVIGVADTNG